MAHASTDDVVLLVPGSDTSGQEKKSPESANRATHFDMSLPKACSMSTVSHLAIWAHIAVARSVHCEEGADGCGVDPPELELLVPPLLELETTIPASLTIVVPPEPLPLPFPLPPALGLPEPAPLGVLLEHADAVRANRHREEDQCGEVFSLCVPVHHVCRSHTCPQRIDICPISERFGQSWPNYRAARLAVDRGPEGVRFPGGASALSQDRDRVIRCAARVESRGCSPVLPRNLKHRQAARLVGRHREARVAHVARIERDEPGRERVARHPQSDDVADVLCQGADCPSARVATCFPIAAQGTGCAVQASASLAPRRRASLCLIPKQRGPACSVPCFTSSPFHVSRRCKRSTAIGIPEKIARERESEAFRCRSGEGLLEGDLRFHVGI